MSLMITTLQTSGLNTNAIAGVIGNISCESGGKIYTLDHSYLRKNGLANYNRDERGRFI